jgi:hypothetical protein
MAVAIALALAIGLAAMGASPLKAAGDLFV